VRADLPPLPGTAPEAPQDIDLDRVWRSIKKTTPEEKRIWEGLPELYREGLQEGFSLGLQFAADFTEEAERRSISGSTPEEKRKAKENRLAEILQSVIK
jgi:hypothetical protein